MMESKKLELNVRADASTTAAAPNEPHDLEPERQL